MSQSASSQNDFNPSDLRSPYQEQTVSPTHARNPFRRQPSWVNPSARYQHLAPVDQDIAEHDDFEYEQEHVEAHGLGLRNIPPSSTVSTVTRKPIKVSASPDPYAPNTPFSQATTAPNSSNVIVDGGKAWGSTPQSSSYSLQESPYKHVPDDVQLVPHNPEGSSHACPTQGELLKTGWTWFTILILVLGVFSWVFSAILFGIGIARPRWGHRIGTDGALSYDAATLLSALVSKLVELSFCTTFVATLGQILTRRAFANTRGTSGKQGISLAEMNMRLWIMQPGTLLTHWTGARHVVTSVLGIIALAAAFSATFYTTAAEALVAPKLKFGNNQTLRLYGQVSTSYGNIHWLTQTCDTPVSTITDPEYSGVTCLQIDLAGNGYRNLNSWMTAWKDLQGAADNIQQAAARPRPPPTAAMYDNTTVYGKWIKLPDENISENITEDSRKYGRLVQSATIVMPHNNVVQAARYPKNRQILQPNDLQGAGAYYLKAAVPAPGVNVLCVGIQDHEVAPLIVNSSLYDGSPRNFSTPIDSIFGWSDNPNPEQGTYHQPWFAKRPIAYNTIANTTRTVWGDPSTYIIVKPPPVPATNDYVICGIRSFTFSNCSTSLFVASSGSELAVHCNSETANDPEIWKSYAETVNKTEKALPMVTSSSDYESISVEWVKAVGLTSGLSDGNASAERLLTQLVPAYSNATDTVLSPSLPSLAEALCVVSSYTLLLSSADSPFVHYWDYAYAENNILPQPAEVSFPAILSYKDYASGGDQEWKGVFYIILAAVFVLNTFCLICLLYYFTRYGEVTDFTEPQNLFALAINSPPSQFLAGACGAGPSSQMLGRKWCVDMVLPEKGDETHGRNITDSSGAQKHEHGTSGAPHFFVRYPEEEPLLAKNVQTPTMSNRYSAFMGLSPSSPVLKRRRKRDRSNVTASRPLSEFAMDDSPANVHYVKISGHS